MGTRRDYEIAKVFASGCSVISYYAVISPGDLEIEAHTPRECLSTADLLH